MLRTKLILLTFIFQYILYSQNINISNGLVFEGEPYIISNPNNSNHIVVAWMGFTGGPGLSIKTKTSFNGGATWSTVKVLPHFASTHKSADPSLAFDNLGNIYACYIDYRESPDSGGVYVIKSIDGGLNWSGATKAIDMYVDGSKKPIDRPWMSINPINNHIYITSKPPTWVSAPNRAYFVASTDAGTSWQAVRYIDTTGYLIGNLIAQPMATNTVSSTGEILVIYPSYVASQNILPGFILARSTNDGASFTYQGVYYSNTSGSDTLAKLGYKLIADPSNSNHIVFVYLSKMNGDLDVMILESINGGTNWSTPKRVNDDALSNGKMQDLVWADFDEDGDLALAWRDRRNASGTGYSTDSEIWGAIKWKDSSSISANFKISDTMAIYNALYLTQSGNDFMGIDMLKDTLNAVWGDVRNGVLNIYFSRKSLREGTTEIQLLSSEKIDDINIYPNPTSSIINIEGSDILNIILIDGKGSTLEEFKGANQMQLSMGNYPQGKYYLYIKTKEGTVFRKIIIKK
jgi:hypothetical protein